MLHSSAAGVLAPLRPHFFLGFCRSLCASSCPVSLLFDSVWFCFTQMSVIVLDNKNGNKMLKTGSAAC